MSAQKWLSMFACTVLLIVGLYALANVLVDPFGAFGDPLMDWYSFDMTNNPRVAKIVYLDKHHDEYDSYIVGCSSANGYSTELLNKYLGARFYNLFAYGCDMYDIGATARYAIEEYHPKNLVVNLGVTEASEYNVDSDDGMNDLHYKVDGSSPLIFYKGFALKNYKYIAAKLRDRRSDTWLPQKFDVFLPSSGEYDKRARDVEHIGALPKYFEDNPDFQRTTLPPPKNSLLYTRECVETLREIKDLCDENDVNVYFIFPPLLRSQLNGYSPDELADYMTALASAVDFWDFSDTTISDDPRYFYDATHFRNAVGDMMLARIFNDDEVYRPDDFGEFVTADNVDEHVRRFYTSHSVIEHTAKLPVLLYHHIADTGDPDTFTPVELFESHMKTLHDAGYTPVSFREVVDYVYRGTPLPEKPVCITFDDGYLSNYTEAFPVLKRYGFKATIFAIGTTVGQSEHYKDTEFPITPHFNWDQAREMRDSGLINIESHTYDMHQHPEYDSPNPRQSVLALPSESEEDYLAAVTADYNLMKDALLQELGHPSEILAYPKGAFDTRSEALFRSLGIKVTLGVQPGVNELVMGLPQCLYGMYRFSAGSVGPETILEYCGSR